MAAPGLRPPTRRVVGLLAGMGPAAGADFLRLFVNACGDWLAERDLPVTDQSYPEHWVAQLPIPDRTQALLETGAYRDAPFEPLAAGIARLQGLGAVAVGMACNTAHAWHARLQARYPDLELLHMPREVAALVRSRGHGAAALMATQGTYASRLYAKAFAEAGIACHEPELQEREWLMQGIYEGVKAGHLALAREKFVTVGRALLERHGDLPLVMGCTEIPLPLVSAPQSRGWELVNSTEVLARALARRAFGKPASCPRVTVPASRSGGEKRPATFSS